MIVTKSIAEVRRWRLTLSKPLAIVPTMGNLHEGHLTLVRTALGRAAHAVVTIFVNPTQFGPNEDFANYPRTLASDLDLLRAERVDLAFAPDPDEMYLNGLAQPTTVHVGEIANDLCGAFRPGHFDGVATVVAKLFGIVQPNVACFGEKDYQQLLVVRQIIRDLNLPIELVGVPTARAPDGLALSSRNRYLTPEERAIAPLLQQTLQAIRERLLQSSAADIRPLAGPLEEWAEDRLTAARFKVDYVRVRDADTLRNITDTTKNLCVLAAARLGKTRLIDNLRFCR